MCGDSNHLIYSTIKLFTNNVTPSSLNVIFGFRIENQILNMFQFQSQLEVKL